MNNYFSQSYSEARYKFLDTAHESGANIYGYRHPSATGPHGEGLFVDVAVFGPKNASNFFINVSGIHGVEGFAGSAIQIASMKTLGSKLPSKTALVFVHAINPWGFAFNCRWTEDGVDLNRNFIDHTQPPQNPAYERLHSRFALEGPRDLPKAIYSLLKEYKSNPAHFQRALTQGQYLHSDGLYYGGDQPIWSRIVLEKIVANHTQNAQRIIHLDWHTGLGEFGTSQIIMDVPTASDAYQYAKTLWRHHTVTTTHSTNADSLSSPLTGEVFRVYDPIIKEHGIPVITASLEIGTRDPAGVFLALWSSALYRNSILEPGQYDPLSLAGHLNQWAFSPSDNCWKQQALKSGLNAFTAAVGAAASLPAFRDSHSPKL